MRTLCSSIIGDVLDKLFASIISYSSLPKRGVHMTRAQGLYCDSFCMFEAQLYKTNMNMRKIILVKSGDKVYA